MNRNEWGQREGQDQVRRTREAICIRKEEYPMNRDKGGQRGARPSEKDKRIHLYKEGRIPNEQR